MRGAIGSLSDRAMRYGSSDQSIGHGDRAARVKKTGWQAMRRIVRSNAPVLIHFVTVLLRDAGLSPQLVDQHISAIEGSIGALPRRVLVASDELAQAKRVMQEADMSQWISSDADRA